MQSALRAALLVLLIALTMTVLLRGEPYILNSINLIFHEAGHVYLGFFGEFIAVLGGTLGQLLIPTIFGVYFLLQRDFFAASVLLWWFGENLINISVYVADARAQVLPLIGGGHDWAYLLGRLGVLEQDVLIGSVVYWLGVATMVGAIAVGGYVLAQQRKLAH
jgi:hypothetical protein